jgi:hypothetical protein
MYNFITCSEQDSCAPHPPNLRVLIPHRSTIGHSSMQDLATVNGGEGGIVATPPPSVLVESLCKHVFLLRASSTEFTGSHPSPS